MTFGYDPYTPVLKNVSLKIEPGQFIGIVGKSGSGKTTLVNLLCRFYDVQQGEVLIDGVDVRTIARTTCTEQVGAGAPGAVPVPRQHRGEHRLRPAGRRAHRRHGRGQGRQRPRRSSSQMPAGYDTHLGERGAGLSGGERQRVTIARALLCDPSILILDEATSSVDTESEQEIQQALARAGQGPHDHRHRPPALHAEERRPHLRDGRRAESSSRARTSELMELEAASTTSWCASRRELTRVEMT